MSPMPEDCIPMIGFYGGFGVIGFLHGLDNIAMVK